VYFINKGNDMTKFTLLTCVYAKENPIFFSQCIESILAQTVIPDEWIIVKDGPLTGELEAVLGKLCFPNDLKILALPENVTLGMARAEGLKTAAHAWVALMDCDDICDPHRFEKQLEMIEANSELGLIGGQISEFIDNNEHVIAKRAVPTEHDDIVSFAKKRNPFNAMTVMFKRDTALSAGNFRYFPGFEDYDLWTRMIKNGTRCGNHPDILVSARVGGMYARRRGVSYIRSEWRMQRQLKKLGLINGAEFVRNAVMRMPVRLLPRKGLAAVYNKFAR